MLGHLLLVATSLVSVVAAQAGGSKVAFTSVPALVETGETYNVTWGGGNGSPVTLTLRKGDPSDLETVGIIADRIATSYYEWKVAGDLVVDDDYALQITQGQEDINYSGLFSLVEGEGDGVVSSTTTSMTAGNETVTTSASATRYTNGTESSTVTESSGSNATGLPTGSVTVQGIDPSKHPSSPSAGGPGPTMAPSSGSTVVQVGSSAAFAMAVLCAVRFMK